MMMPCQLARSGCWNRAANTPHSGVLDEEGEKELNKQGRELDITGFHFEGYTGELWSTEDSTTFKRRQ